MVEYKRNQYISVSTMSCHIVMAGSFLLCFHYTVVSLDTYVAKIESERTHLEELARLESILVGMLIVNKIFINYFYSNQHRFYLPTPKVQIKNFFIIVLDDAFAAYILLGMLVVAILPRFFPMWQCIIALLLNFAVTYKVYYFLIILNSLPGNKRTFTMIGSNRRAVKFARFLNQTAFSIL